MNYKKKLDRFRETLDCEIGQAGGSASTYVFT